MKGDYYSEGGQEKVSRSIRANESNHFMAGLEPFINERKIDIYYERVLSIISSAVRVILKAT